MKNSSPLRYYFRPKENPPVSLMMLVILVVVFNIVGYILIHFLRENEHI